MRNVKFFSALLCLMASTAMAQYPTPHAGWKLVLGAENLITSSYWGTVYFLDSYSDTAAPPIGTIGVTNGVLNVTSTPGNYFGGPSDVGPWLTTSGDFGIIATIQTGANMSGFISLTGSLSTGTQYWQGNTVVEAGIDPTGGYSLFYFDGTSPNVAKSTGKAGPGTPPAGELTVEILRQNGQITAYFNGVALPSLADPGLFAKQWVMPGVIAPPSQTLAITQFALEVPQSDTGAKLVQAVGNLPVSLKPPTLGSLAAAAGKYFSVEAQAYQLGVGSAQNGIPDLTLGPNVLGQFQGLAMYETGWDQVQPQQNWYDFDAADAIMATARATGHTPMFCHGGLGGGTSVTPYWVSHSNFTAAQLMQVIQSHLQTVIGRYQSMCDGWTIVNESLANDGTVSAGFFAQALGSGYITTALQAARAADPNLKLYITDFGIENAGTKADGMYNLISSLKKAGVPVDGVGWEGHFALNGSSPYRPNYSQMVANMAKLATLGVQVRITELDERILLPATAQNLADQATDYAIVVQACLDSPNCVGVQAFDSDDLTSWIPGTFPGYGAATMFDSSFHPKPAYTTVMNTLSKAPKAPPTIVSVVTASGGPVIAQNTYIAVRGFNLVPSNTSADGVIWSNAPDFAQGRMPTQLNNVSVTVNGKPAFVYYYCSAATSSICTIDQINVLTPLDSTTGPVQVVVNNGTASSAAFTVTMQPTAPTLLLFNLSGPAVATHLNYTLVGSPILYPGASTPAKPGEQVVLWAVGFGLPTATLVNGSATQSGGLPYTPQCQVGGMNANAVGALVAAGLYQINLTIPTTAVSGNNSLTCTYNGVATEAGAYITVQQ
jgi:endo-1,4-beta-xylanase